MKRIVVRTPHSERLSKYLAHAGVASRRSVDLLIEKKCVAVNGKHAVLGLKVNDGDIITITSLPASFSYALYYKPRGETTGVIAKYSHLHPVGRLDKESEGLILYTNDFRVTEALLLPEKKRPKEYLVTTREQMTPRVERILLSGIRTQEGVYAPALKVDISENKHEVTITLIEGKKHEVRRMLNALSLTVLRLVRVKLLFLTLRYMQPGVFRLLTDKEREKLLFELGLTEQSDSVAHSS